MNASARFDARIDARVDGGGTFQAGADLALSVVRDNASIRVMADGEALLSLRFDSERGVLAVSSGPGDSRQMGRGLSAAAEALFGWHPSLEQLVLDLGERQATASELARDGLVVLVDGAPVLLPEMLMQRRESWLTDAARPSYPLSYVMSDGKRHPRRPPKPAGRVYGRFIPWLSEVISFRVVHVERDLALVHRWLNDPRVDAFWNEAGDLDKHRQYLSKILADPHMLPLIGCFGERPFGYFELYWAKENRIAPFYDAGDHDRGWHVIVGEDAFRGRDFITAWLPSLMHYMFLDDPRTMRIVGEPAAAHVQQLRNLDRAGFSQIKTFDFPHKRATLVMLLRERFFGDRLWQPAAKDAVLETQR
ncbi:putative acetylase [Bradyrhizobium sp. ORS 285]|uniref:GNAT family N-acetyltransferase n=1 Tax=Bradyrhizobium sp. ORS 285 TaxID=115808 RepID=UPI000240789B|nr:GNAT family N-acetyltransferase [Bradyrhizobium sp. ORS 285]CCD85599.1 putative acetylase [Bradyrhizobium sp. ORS 285]SMX59874.1 putative acetylase [Bradyrhizobium sp. ORS 285]